MHVFPNVYWKLKITVWDLKFVQWQRCQLCLTLWVRLKWNPWQSSILHGVTSDKLYVLLVQNVNWDYDMVIPLEVLGKLNKLNNDVDGLKVPYDSFYLTELTEKVDVRLDYLKWLMTKDPHLVSNSLLKISLVLYEFIWF